MRNQMTRAEEAEAVVVVAGSARGARDDDPRDSLETVEGDENASCRRTREGARADADADAARAAGRRAIADIGAVAFATLRCEARGRVWRVRHQQHAPIAQDERENYPHQRYAGQLLREPR